MSDKQLRPSNLHGQMMNLHCNVPEAAQEWPTYGLAYKIGHRDARHAAAEIALQADDEIESLREAKAELLQALQIAVRQNEHNMLMTGEELRICSAAIAKHGEQA